MMPLVFLAIGFVLARLTGLAGVDALDGWQPALRVGLALMFVVTGLAHFAPRMRAGMIAMVPPRLPRPDLLVTVTGVLALAGAIGLLIPATARLAAGALALLMIAMFPANVSAARRKLSLGGRPVPSIGPRTALQLLWVGLATALAFAA
ncbi:Uncharacterized membrane protein [Asanoa hainanensis]|uniref:Uncharacterized membrane protein n=1 Tax=Asanoa hainanensis TaxID=560556 RepID=A0A239KLW6_9ACTN|nr:DoxX family protein [Asanoa hainanensis]SNT18589.1 Uncharacterized membrane protein [Asanoa hainanensis]